MKSHLAIDGNGNAGIRSGSAGIPHPPSSRTTAWLLVCFTCSGISGLIYEVAWVRSLELIFGTTTFAIATVLAAFMGGLACGSFFMGRLSARFERYHPLRVYAVLECLIAVLAILIPFFLDALVPLYQWVWRATHASFVWFSILRFALSVLVLLLPTFLMGATLPVASNFVTRAFRRPGGGEGSDQDGERRIGLLYSFNTLGAVLGCLGAGLVLFPTVGLAATQWVAMGFNLVAAAGAFVLARTSVERSSSTLTNPSSPDHDGVAADRASEDSKVVRPIAGAGLLVLAYAVSGFVAMLYEVAWSRVLVLVFGSSTYAYTIMLGTFLLGLALGAWLMTRWAHRVSSPLLSAGCVQLLIAVTTLASVFLVEELPYLYLKAYEALQPSPRGLLGVQFLLAGGLMILPTLGLGAMFPVTMHGLRPRGQRAGRVVGWAYALNTLGAIGGSVLAGFFLVPEVGSRNTLLLGIGLNVLLAAVTLVAANAGPGWLVRWRVAAALLLLLVFGNLLATTPAWSPAVLSSGVFRYVSDYSGLDRKGFRERAQRIAGELLLFDEGLTCTVTVSRTPESVTLMVNGKPDASTPSGLGNPLDTNAPPALYDLPTQILLGQLPLLLSPRQDRVLVIGLGSGLTAGSVLTHPVKQMDCIELEKAVVQGSRFFEDHNQRPLADPRTSIIVNDARNHLLVTDTIYDVIISEPSNPWIPGAANLFTRESFENSRQRLGPDGIFCQWLQLYELQAQDFATVLRTFGSVFPHVHLFRVNHDAILIGSVTARPIDVEAVRGRLTEAVRRDLARIDIRGVPDLLARYWIGGAELAACVPAVPLNTDDNMRIEFTAPLQVLAGGDRNTGVASIARMFEGRTTAAIPQVRLGPGVRPETFWADVSEATLRNKGVESLIYAQHSLGLALNPKAVGVQVDAWLSLGRLDEARTLLTNAVTQFADAPEIQRGLTRLEMRGANWKAAQEHAERWRSLEPESPFARYNAGRCLFQLGRDDDAQTQLESLDPVLARREEFRDLPFYLGVLQARAGRTDAAIENLNSFLRRMPLHTEARTVLAVILQKAGRAPEAAVQWQKIAVLNIRQSEKLRDEAAQLWRDGKKTESLARLKEAMQLDPSNTDLVIELARAWRISGDKAAATKTLQQYLTWHPDRAPAIGYLGQLLQEQEKGDEAKLLQARYRALTGTQWEELR